MGKYMLQKDVYLNEEVVLAGTVVELDGSTAKPLLERGSIVENTDETVYERKSAFDLAKEETKKAQEPFEKARLEQAAREAEAAQKIAESREEAEQQPADQEATATEVPLEEPQTDSTESLENSQDSVQPSPEQITKDLEIS